MTFVDLTTPAQDAVVAALAPLATAEGMPAGLQVGQHIPQNAQPPYIMIGQISVDNQAEREQLEELTVEVICVHRGQERRTLLAMQHAVRLALHGQPIGPEDGSGPAIFETPRFLKAEAGDAIADGVTYVGASTFAFYAQPA